MLALALAASSALALPTVASAVEVMAFTPAALDAAKASGKPIIIDVTAPWCPTCRAQKPILSKLLAEPAYRDVVFFSIDFDSQKPFLRKLGVSAQSTLIAYRGAREAARSTGDTDAVSIRTLLDKAI
ncbi:thioredoxin family protein [Methylobacterium haplocladii]|nr:thioredoxin family protein [Methylobacterium haplocladii]